MKIKNDKRLTGILIFGVFFLMMLLAHKFTYFVYGDDIKIDISKDSSLFTVVREAYISGKDFFCRYLYSTFGAFMYTFLDGKLKKPIIAICYPLMAWGIYKMFGKEKNDDDKLIACSMILYVPWRCLSEAGWLSTILSYLLPGAVALVACTFIKYVFTDNKINIIKVIAGGMILYIACGHEQISLLMCGMLIIMLCRSIFIKKINYGQLFYLCISMLQSYRALTWSGNSKRVAKEAIAYFPDYYSLNFIDKLYIGFEETMTSVFIACPLPVTIFSVIIAIIILKMYRNDMFLCLLGIIPAIFSLVFGFLRPVVSIYFGDIYRVFGINVSISNFQNIRPYLSVFLTILWVGFVIIDIYLIYKNSFKTLLNVFLLLGGICTKVIMGFSASIYMSGVRTALVLFIVLMIIAYSLVMELKLYLDKKKSKTLTYILIVFSFISYIDFLSYI